MNFSDLFRESFSAISTNKSRSLLLLMGLVIGIAAVVTVVSIGDGASVVIQDLLGGYGSKSILIIPNWSVIEESRGEYDYEELTREDVTALNEQVSALVGVTPQISMELPVRRGGKEETVQIMGTLPLFLEVNGLEVAEGRGLWAGDDKFMRKVALIGADLKETLFGTEEALGQLIRLPGVGEVRVVGVLKRKEQNVIASVANFDNTYNNTLFVPAATVERLGGSSFIYFLQGEAVSEDRIDEAVADILAILRYNHGKYGGVHDKFMVESMGGLIDTIGSTIKTLTLFISFIAGISLVVAGVGVMNIMLVSIKERTREIGTRKALGAAPYVILNQIMLETVMLCGTGGLLGALLSAVSVHTIARYSGWPGLINGKMLIVSVALSLVTGLIFGLIPASRAADMDPVEALRYE